MHTDSEFSSMEALDFRQNWDYRLMPYPGGNNFTHPRDRSVCTYRGHSVLRTLIRCYFSPSSTTGQRYLYTGSEDGKIHVFGLDGEIVRVIDVNAIKLPQSPLDAFRRNFNSYHMNWNLEERAVVRDIAWHPFHPFLACSTWCCSSNVDGMIVGYKWRTRNETEKKPPKTKEKRRRSNKNQQQRQLRDLFRSFLADNE